MTSMMKEAFGQPRNGKEIVDEMLDNIDDLINKINNKELRDVAVKVANPDSPDDESSEIKWIGVVDYISNHKEFVAINHSIKNSLYYALFKQRKKHMAQLLDFLLFGEMIENGWVEFEILTHNNTRVIHVTKQGLTPFYEFVSRKPFMAQYILV